MVFRLGCGTWGPQTPSLTIFPPPTPSLHLQPLVSDWHQPPRLQAPPSFPEAVKVQNSSHFFLPC